MSASFIPAASTVLVTGASGFVGAHVMDALLRAGYKVKGTVRSHDKANELLATRSQYKSNITFAIVADIAAEHAFDEAVRDVDAVCHVASPFHHRATDNERDMLLPAIQGTKNLLVAAAQHKRIKRVVITSSFAAVMDLSKGLRPGYAYTESDWNLTKWDDAVNSSSTIFVYCASKALAEKAAWDYVKEAQTSFDIVTMNPPYVFGPMVHPVNGVNGLNESTQAVYNAITAADNKVQPTGIPAFVDVRDLADAHVRSLQIQEAGGHRFLICGGSYTWQQVCDTLRDKFPTKHIPLGTPHEQAPPAFRLDTTSAEKVLKINKWITLEQCLTDTARQLYELQDASNKH